MIQLSPIADGLWLATCTECGRAYETRTGDPAKHAACRRCARKAAGPVRVEGLAPVKPAKPELDTCPHRGLTIGGFRGTGCGGKPFTLPIYSCGLYGTCTERPTPAGATTFAELGAGHRACQGCPRG